MEFTHFRENIQHLRNVHYTLLLVTAITGYLLIRAWSPTPELKQELRNFEAIYDAVSRQETVLRTLRSLDSQIPTDHTILERGTAKNLIGAAPARSVDKARVTIADIRKEIAQASVYRSNLSPRLSWGLFDSSDPVIQTRLWSMFRHLFLSEALPGTHFPVTGTNGRSWLVQPSWFGDVRFNGGLITREAVRARLYPMRSDGTVEGAGIGVNIQRFPPNDSWFPSRFPNLTKAWSAVSKLTLAEANGLAERELISKLDNSRSSLFGLDVRGGDLAFVGPGLMLALLIYISGYVSHHRSLILRSPRSNELKDALSMAPWVCLLPNLVGFLITTITLTVIPAVIGFTAVNRILMWDLKHSFVAATAYVFVGLKLQVDIVAIQQYRFRRPDMMTSAALKSVCDLLAKCMMRGERDVRRKEQQQSSGKGKTGRPKPE